MALLLFLRVEQSPFPVRFAVIPKLEGVAGNEYPRGTYKSRKGVFIAVQKLVIAAFRRVAGHNQQNGNGALVTAWVFKIICKILEDQPLVQSPE